MSAALEEQLGTFEREAVAEREVLEARRRSLSLDAIGGDANAATELRDVEARLSELERKADQAARARLELAERLQAEQEAAVAAETARKEAELLRLVEERLRLFRDMQRHAVRTGRNARELLEVDQRCVDLSRELGRPTGSWRLTTRDMVS